MVPNRPIHNVACCLATRTIKPSIVDAEHMEHSIVYFLLSCNVFLSIRQICSGENYMQ